MKIGAIAMTGTDDAPGIYTEVSQNEGLYLMNYAGNANYSGTVQAFYQKGNVVGAHAQAEKYEGNSPTPAGTVFVNVEFQTDAQGHEQVNVIIRDTELTGAKVLFTTGVQPITYGRYATA